ncbi:MAG: polymer-forming cytoskeletal protein [bacterium]|nr:polymer-forming cytoskeletal protein [bacterium]
MKKTTLLLACLAVLFLPLAASAYSVKNGDSIYVSKDQVIEGNLYAAGANLTIDGRVTGDIICAGQAININGQVDGDIICGGQSINVSGQVGGSLRLAGNAINLSGQVARNAMIFGNSFTTSASSTIGWDLTAYGNNFNLQGSIGRDLYGQLGQAAIAGQIGKNVRLKFSNQTNQKANPLIIANTAKINGDVIYTANQEAQIASGAVIKGQTTRNLPKIASAKSDFTDLAWWWGKLIGIFSALVIGLVLISFWREQILKITDLMLNRVGASLGWGILALLLTPIIAIILLITIIGIPLSLILLMLWLIALYLSKILVGILIGRSLLNNFLPKQKDSLTLAMILGIIVSYLIFALPIIGWPVSLLAMLWGLGGIFISARL